MIRFLTVIIGFFLSTAVASDGVFTVPEVPVFAEAKTSAQAQDKARQQGRAVAFDLLLRRLVAEQDWMYLPSLSTGQAAPALERDYDAPYRPRALPGSPGSEEEERTLPKLAIDVDAAALQSYEQETNVFDEKSSGTTYRARITYRFKPDAVRRLLRSSRLPYSEEQAREALILPVLVTSQGVYLWEAKNPWARAWLARSLTSELTPLVLPRGDAADVEAITAQEALSLNAERLRSFADRYPSERLLLAVGRLNTRGDEFRLSVRLLEATPPNARGAQTSAIGTTITEAYFRGAADDFPALARRAVDGTVQRHARDWKRRTLVDYSRRRTFQLTAWFGGQREWADIQQAIGASALVVDKEDGVFNKDNAIFDLTVVGEESQFRLAMQQFGLDVWQDIAGRWHIANQARADVLKQSLKPLTTDLDAQGPRRRGIGRLFGRRTDEDPQEGIETDAVPPLRDGSRRGN